MDNQEFQNLTGLDPNLLMTSHIYREFGGKRHYIIPKGKKSGTPLTSVLKRMSPVTPDNTIEDGLNVLVLTEADGDSYVFYPGEDEDVNGFFFKRFVKTSYDREIAKGKSEAEALGIATIITMYRNASIEIDTVLGHEPDFSIVFDENKDMFTLANISRINGKLFNEFPEYRNRFLVSPEKPPLLNDIVVEDSAEISTRNIADVHYGSDSVGSGLDFDLLFLDFSNSKGVFFVSLESRNGHDKQMKSARVNVVTREVNLLERPYPDHVDGSKRKLSLSDFA